MARLAARYRLIAPDLRGFGESDKPKGAFGAQDHAAGMLAFPHREGPDRAATEISAFFDRLGWR
jgi:pimeloyl-ACP methyl ester carboxylesterase